jgi:hypothetical protein
MKDIIKIFIILWYLGVSASIIMSPISSPTKTFPISQPGICANCVTASGFETPDEFAQLAEDNIKNICRPPDIRKYLSFLCMS